MRAGRKISSRANAPNLEASIPSATRGIKIGMKSSLKYPSQHPLHPKYTNAHTCAYFLCRIISCLQIIYFIPCQIPPKQWHMQRGGCHSDTTRTHSPPHPHTSSRFPAEDGFAFFKEDPPPTISETTSSIY